MKKTWRLLALLLSLCMAVVLLPAAAYADEVTEVATEEELLAALNEGKTNIAVAAGGGALVLGEDLLIPDGCTLTIMPGAELYSNGMIENYGTIKNSGTFENALILDNYGTFTNAEGSEFKSNSGVVTNYEDGKFENKGTYENVTGGAFFNDGTVVNQGDISNSNDSGFYNSSDFTNAATGTIDNQGILTNEGTLDNKGSLANDGELDNQGTFTNNGTFENSGSFNNDGDLENPPPVISTDTFPAGVIGKEYAVTLSASNSPTSWSASDLPTGLSINNSGVITGTPTEAGEATVQITAKNSFGSHIVSYGLTIHSLTVTAPSFQAAEVGYTQPAAQQIVIRNGGTAEAAISKVELVDDRGAGFILSGPGTDTVAAGAGNTSWSIQPKGTLAAGNYTARIAVSYDFGSVYADVNFSVSAHTHTYGEEWKSDSSSHWHECTAGDGAKAGVAAHTSDGGKVTTAATEKEKGVKTYSCTVCGRVLKTEAIPAAGTTADIARTGDTGNIGIWVALMLLAGAGLTGTILAARKRKSH